MLLWFILVAHLIIRKENNLGFQWFCTCTQNKRKKELKIFGAFTAAGLVEAESSPFCLCYIQSDWRKISCQYWFSIGFRFIASRTKYIKQKLCQGIKLLNKVKNVFELLYYLFVVLSLEKYGATYKINTKPLWHKKLWEFYIKWMLENIIVYSVKYFETKRFSTFRNAISDV